MNTRALRIIAAATAIAWSGAAGASGLPDGKALYNTYCAACHASGAVGAPKTGDAPAWERRAKKGINSLYASALKGQGAMPARGGNASLSDAQVMAAVNYIIGSSWSTTTPAAAPRPTAAAKVPAVDDASAAARTSPESAVGKNVYQMSCAACHTAGIAGAPKLGDGPAWSSRMASGLTVLYASAIRGKGAMPPKGGNAGLGDADVRAAVDFIVAQVKRPSLTVASAPATRNDATAATSAPPEPARALVVRSTAPAASAASASLDPNAFNRLLATAGKRNAPPMDDGIHDPASPGTVALQPPALAFERLTRSNGGNHVNWVASLARKEIQPRWDVKAPGEPPVMDMNIVREVKGTMPDVVYPHKQHTEWLDCANCHPAIFLPQKGANRMSMAAIVMGKGCGTCHGKVAFPISECRLCHSRNKDAAARTATPGK